MVRSTEQSCIRLWHSAFALDLLFFLALLLLEGDFPFVASIVDEHSEIGWLVELAICLSLLLIGVSIERVMMLEISDLGVFGVPSVLFWVGWRWVLASALGTLYCLALFWSPGLLWLAGILGCLLLYAVGATVDYHKIVQRARR